MRRALLLAALLLAPVAGAQVIIEQRPGIGIPEPVPGYYGFASLRIETTQGEYAQLLSPWFAVGVDTIVNLSMRNEQAEPANITFRINATGAAVTPDTITLELAPYEAKGATFAVRPDDVGTVRIHAEAIDSFTPGGEPVSGDLGGPALLLPSARWLDPPPLAPIDPDSEFEEVSSYRGTKLGMSAYIRIRPGESVRPRLELTNVFETTVPAFRVRLQLPTQMGMDEQVLDVDAMGPGESTTLEFDEWTPIEQGFGGFYGGPMGSWELRPSFETAIGGEPVAASPASFRIERGAVVDVEPTVAVVDVQEGVAVDLLVPRKPVLGVPTRIVYNLSNLATERAEGRLTLQVMTPGNLFYEVQGPETHQVSVSLAPGQESSGSIDFTPRVTGTWSVQTIFRSGNGFGYGGGGAFTVKGPLAIGFDRVDQVFARIGEPVEVGISLASTDTIQDAQLRVGSGTQYYSGDPTSVSGADYRPGFADSLIESRSLTSSLGTLRPGGSVNASVEVKARSSGYYNIVPYVIAEGFAYTSTPENQPGGPIPIDGWYGVPYYQTMLSIFVSARPVPVALSLAPFVVALAFFVGAWTMRTRFVR